MSDRDAAFKALSDPTRRLILEELLDRDGLTLFDLTTRLIMKHGLTISRQGISKHIAVLESSGLLRLERDGRYVLHYLETGPLEEIEEAWLAHFTRTRRQG